ncbi:MAG: ATP-binding protein, partial [Flavobacterium sp.]
MKETTSAFDFIIPVSLQKGETISIELAELFVNHLKIVQEAKHGRVKISRGNLIYTPDKDFKGTDYLTYSGESKQGIRKTGMIVFSVGEIVFKPRARLLIQLGEKLIKNESIALTELVKNAYDADASYCKVHMNHVEDKQVGEIIIEDDGWGMDLDIIRNAWLEPGSDNKEKVVKAKQYSEKGRLPIGEKGIGRFGVHKLGREIELVTRKQGEDEVVVKINWEDFEQHKYLDKAPVSVSERKPEVFLKEATGTRIIIRKLTRDWTRGMVRDAFRAINATSIPLTYDIEKYEQISKKKPDPNGFSALPTIDKTEWIEDIPKWQDILQYALFFFDIELENDQITKFNYTFRPWENMKSVKGRKVSEKDEPVHSILDIPDLSHRKYFPLEIPKGVAIGKVKFQGCIYVRDKGILKLALDKPTFLSDYLNENGGIRIYRNGLRIYDYGERENDWLDLDYRRFNDPGVKVSNNMILASITLNRETSSGLIEKTNREGFIENESYKVFKNQILYALKLVELCRLSDKKALDETSKPKVETESVLKSIDSLKSYIGEKITNKKTQEELNFYVDRVEKNYTFMYNTLVKTASAGMGWGIYIHEIEKIIKEIEKA